MAEQVAVIDDSIIAREINLLKYELLRKPDDELVKELLARHQSIFQAERQPALDKLARIRADIARHEAKEVAEGYVQSSLRLVGCGILNADAVDGATIEMDYRSQQGGTHGKDGTDQIASTVRLSLILYRVKGHSKRADNWIS